MSAGLTQVALALAAIDTLEHQVAAIESAVAQLARGEPVEDLPPVQAARDRIWTCLGCGSRLGVYDQEHDLLLIKYKDLYVQVHAGEGGFVKTLCRSCGRENLVDYRP